ncbi:MAG: pantoate--beta-alanine ligase [Chitinophagaceae bacterium]|nr:pantoate--beta-alanine ligase [Chitinophagaceae bacterium]
MVLFRKRNDLEKWLESQRLRGLHIGFVPTMGALHEGHSSLIRAARADRGIVVCSIFVNPTQFNDPKDFEKYPITTGPDIQRLLADGCDALFLPAVSEIYPEQDGPIPRYDLGFLETLLEGSFRPGHFQGVCRVVEKLLRIVGPDRLYLGQKDYQQCMVISRLVEIMDKKEDIRIVICPTLREADGLAMSSRNMRLSTSQRKTAVEIYNMLSMLKHEIKPGSLSALLLKANLQLESAGFRIDYISLADANNLSPVDNWDGQQHTVALVAAFLGEIRLIDNMVLT